MPLGKEFYFRNQLYRVHVQTVKLLFFISIICLCIALGAWQLQRYHFKKNLIASSHVLQRQGKFLNELTIVLTNRQHEGKPGFEVLTPFQVQNDKRLILVNRGWLPASASIPAAQATKIEGDIKLTEYQFILGKNVLATSPLTLQRIDIPEIEKQTQHLFHPYVLRLSPAMPDGFVREWLLTAVTPQRHLGYAMQWFLLAMALCVATLLFCCEKVKGQTHANYS